jgi:hypothetical protein
MKDNSLAATCYYIPKLYIPSTWQPKAAKHDVEAAISHFDCKLTELYCHLPKTRRYNLSQPHRYILNKLATCKDLLIFPTIDKYLGPSMAECDNYISDVLNKHLLNHKNYEFLPNAMMILPCTKAWRKSDL